MRIAGLDEIPLLLALAACGTSPVSTDPALPPLPGALHRGRPC
jgi:hypothetical protein